MHIQKSLIAISLALFVMTVPSEGFGQEERESRSWLQRTRDFVNNQNILGARHAVNNLRRLNRDNTRTIYNRIRGNTYQKWEESTLEAMEDGEIPTRLNQQKRYDHFHTYNSKCRPSQDSSTNKNELYKIMSQVESEFCECLAWGDCSKHACPCEILCPNHFGIFDITRDQRVPSMKNSLPFRNTSLAFQNSTHQMTNGFCWGHAAVTQRFQRVGLFKPDRLPPFNQRTNPRGWTKFYKDVIDDVVNNKASEIPGFSSLEELAKSDPAIEEYLKDKVAKSWAREAMSIQGLATVVSSSPMGKRRSNALFSDVMNRLDMGLNPQIIFTQKNNRGATHAVMGHDYKRDHPQRGEVTICINDSNSTPQTNENCRNKMVLSQDGKINYTGWGELGAVVVAHNEDDDTLEQAKSLRDHCMNDKECEG